MKCSECGADIKRRDTKCTYCGIEIRSVYPGSTLGLISFIFGVLGILGCFLFLILSCISLILAIIAIVRSRKAYCKNPLAIISIILFAIAVIQMFLLSLFIGFRLAFSVNEMFIKLVEVSKLVWFELIYD